MALCRALPAQGITSPMASDLLDKAISDLPWVSCVKPLKLMPMARVVELVGENAWFVGTSLGGPGSSLHDGSDTHVRQQK